VWYPYWELPYPYTWYEAHAAVADSKGRLNVRFTVEAPEPGLSVQALWIENDAGEVVLEER
jgi:hypothetical protein